MNRKRNIGRTNYFYIGIVISLYYILWTFIDYSMKDIINPVTQSYRSIILILMLIVICQLITNYFPCFLYARINKSNFIKLFRLNKITFKQLMLSFIIFISFNGISIFLLRTQDIILRNFNMKFEMNNYMIAENIPALMVLILTVGIIIPIGEELFFRGLLLRGMECIRPSFAIVVSAFYFAINHSNPYRLTTLFLFGLLLGLIVYYTNSLICGIILHILNNTVFEIYTYVRGKVMMAQLYDNIASTSIDVYNSYWFILILFLISSLICFFTLKHLKKISTTYDISSNKSYDKKRAIIFIFSALIISTIIFIIRTT